MKQISLKVEIKYHKSHKLPTLYACLLYKIISKLQKFIEFVLKCFVNFHLINSFSKIFHLQMDRLLCRIFVWFRSELTSSIVCFKVFEINLNQVYLFAALPKLSGISFIRLDWLFNVFCKYLYQKKYNLYLLLSVFGSWLGVGWGWVVIKLSPGALV